MPFVSQKFYLNHNLYYSFNGTFKNEPSTHFPHSEVGALGFYRNSPFVTGDYSSEHGLKTEILDYDAQQWNQAAGYPFSDGNR